jgi:hypothetical protein
MRRHNFDFSIYLSPSAREHVRYEWGSRDESLEPSLFRLVRRTGLV